MVVVQEIDDHGDAANDHGADDDGWVDIAGHLCCRERCVFAGEVSERGRASCSSESVLVELWFGAYRAKQDCMQYRKLVGRSLSEGP